MPCLVCPWLHLPVTYISSLSLVGWEWVRRLVRSSHVKISEPPSQATGAGWGGRCSRHTLGLGPSGRPVPSAIRSRYPSARPRDLGSVARCASSARLYARRGARPVPRPKQMPDCCRGLARCHALGWAHKLRPGGRRWDDASRRRQKGAKAESSRHWQCPGTTFRRGGFSPRPGSPAPEQGAQREVVVYTQRARRGRPPPWRPGALAPRSRSDSCPAGLIRQPSWPWPAFGATGHTAPRERRNFPWTFPPTWRP